MNETKHILGGYSKNDETNEMIRELPTIYIDNGAMMDWEIFEFEHLPVKQLRPGHMDAPNFYLTIKTLDANLKAKGFKFYQELFHEIDEGYGKIFDMKTGRMYPEAVKKLWPGGIDNLNMTDPDYINLKLKKEYWLDYNKDDYRFFEVINEGMHFDESTNTYNPGKDLYDWIRSRRRPY